MLASAPGSFRFTGEITAAQRSYFEENGFLKFEEMMTPEQVEIMREDAVSLEARTLRGEIPLADVDDLVAPSIDATGRKVLHRLPYFTRYNARTAALFGAVLPRIAAGLLGPRGWILEDTLHGIIRQMKMGGKTSSYSQIHWHVDFTEDHMLTPVVVVGTYLDASTRENGCLALIPGSHRFPLARRVPPTLFVEAQPGDVICHAHNIYHGSGPVADPHYQRTTIYAYLSGGIDPGPDLPYAPEDVKQEIKTIWADDTSRGHEFEVEVESGA